MNKPEFKRLCLSVSIYTVAFMRWVSRNWITCLAVILAAIITSALCRCGESRQAAVKMVPGPLHRVDTFYHQTLIPTVYYVDVPAVVDTAAVIADYFSHRIYRDTVHFVPVPSAASSADRGAVNIIVTDTVGMNAISGRSVLVDYTPPAASRIRNNAVLIGSSLSAGSQSVWAGYRYKKMTYQAGYDFLNRSVMAGLAIDLMTW